MYIIPAIDILGGKCVRLVQGEYNRYINYEDDPAKKAVEFKNAGADGSTLSNLVWRKSRTVCDY
jgi:phosphoribosylformimino-5-aminoimidazole carboxamide ribotide isomerase